MFSDLLAFDEGELTFGGFAVARLATEIAFVLKDPLPCYEIEFRNGDHRIAADSGMDVEREDASGARGEIHVQDFCAAGRCCKQN